jgi:methylated-DNA-[protein]-cysteine S-methyltransferase
MTYAPHFTSLQTPIGLIRIEGDISGITSIGIGEQSVDCSTSAGPNDSPTMAAAAELREYFAGTRREFTVTVATLTSERGQALRQGIAAIPYGTTMTYGALAKAIGSAPRAIGQACRRNPLPIIIPCHRVTSASGPEYYSAGDGPHTKAWLIEFEAQPLSEGKNLI